MTEKQDILDRLKLLVTGKTRPFDIDLNFYVVAADAIEEIGRLRETAESEKIWRERCARMILDLSLILDCDELGVAQEIARKGLIDE